MEEPNKQTLTMEELTDLIDTSLKEALDNIEPAKNESIILQDSAGARVEFHSSVEPLGALIGSAHDSLSKLKQTNGDKAGMPGVG